MESFPGSKVFVQIRPDSQTNILNRRNHWNGKSFVNEKPFGSKNNNLISGRAVVSRRLQRSSYERKWLSGIQKCNSVLGNASFDIIWMIPGSKFGSKVFPNQIAFLITMFSFKPSRTPGNDSDLEGFCESKGFPERKAFWLRKRKPSFGLAVRCVVRGAGKAATLRHSQPDTAHPFPICTLVHGVGSAT